MDASTHQTSQAAWNPTVPSYAAMEVLKGTSRRIVPAYLGTLPNYSQRHIKGVKLYGVSPNGPAAKAEVKGGDIIVMLNGEDVLDLYDYTAILYRLKIGQETSIVVQRGGKDVELKIIPGSRE
jgi:S1-C subfamily serine protease